MNIDEEKLKMWCEQVDRRLDKLEGKDYEPKEPLIKDEKIRKAIRAWAKSNLIERAKFEYIKGTGSVFANGVFGAKITFYGDLRLTNRMTYEIDDLCGEETPEPLEPGFIDLDERIREKEDE